MTDQEKQPAWKHVTENVECLAIAIVMALMLKFFLIEAYKIPTGSMQPTIMGNADIGLYDRVLVNKFIYLVSEPERFDIIVFKYPLDQSKNYIKRLIGLPGERVGIRGGDIYVNGKIERKPESAVTAVLKRLFPAGTESEDFAAFFGIDGPGRVTGPDSIEFSGPGRAFTRQPVRAGYLDGYDPDYGVVKPRQMLLDEHLYVGDIRLAFEAELTGAGSAVSARIEEAGREHALLLAGPGHPQGSRMTTGPAGAEDPALQWLNPDFRLQEGRRHEIVFSNIDDRLALFVDNDLEAVLDYEYEANRAADPANRVVFGAEGGQAAFHDVTVSRDIHYLAGRGNKETVDYHVPAGHYFALGDNTQNSADSRLWEAVVFTLADGEVIKGNRDLGYGGSPYRDPNPKTDTYGIKVKNIYGDCIHIPGAELSGRGSDTVDEHYIPEKLMLGKAMVVFWPVYPHFRWKLLR